MDATELDKLVAIKKKSDSSAKTRQKFKEEWLRLVKSEGLGINEMKYLYEGFTFSGASPLVACFQENESSFAGLQIFFAGSDYVDKNKSITSKLLLHLLALSLKNIPGKHEIIKFAIKELPFYCNEKGRLTDSKVFKKYFIQELSDNTLFPEIDISDIKTGFKSFCIRIMKNLEDVGNEKETTESDKRIGNRVMDWLSSYKLDNDTVLAVTDNKPEVNIKTSENDKAVPKKANLTAMDYITSIIADVNDLGKIVTNILTDNDCYESENENLKNELAEKDRLFLKEREQNQNLFLELSQVKEKISKLSEEIKNQEIVIASKDTEIKSREKLKEISLRQKDEEKELIINKISGTLKIEYKDFLDGVELPMTLDLGENMREQLKSVFSVLKKHGINLE